MLCIICTELTIQTRTQQLSKAGLERKRFHDLRHTVASLLINANENPKVIQQLLGHSTISTTLDIYAHVMGETMNKSIDTLYNQLELDNG